jgi:large subunit ribosomal protein L24
MAMHVRKNDLVEVISGDHRGARGKILRVDRRKGKVVVEGVNLVYRHVRPTRRNPQGGRVQKEAPLAISNILPLDAVSGKSTRVRFPVETDRLTGRIVSKKRVSVKGTAFHTLSRAGRSAKK